MGDIRRNRYNFVLSSLDSFFELAITPEITSVFQVVRLLIESTIDGGPNGDLKSMTRALVDRFGVNLAVTPNQDLLIRDVHTDRREEVDRVISEFRGNQRSGAPFSDLRKYAVACVGLPTCSLSYTDSERLLPVVIDQLDALGYHDLCESIGMSGCERQCSRPGTKVIGWVGAGKDLYKLKLGGTADADTQGTFLSHSDGRTFLTRVQRGDLVSVTAALFDAYRAGRNEGEGMGAFVARTGNDELIKALSADVRTELLMKASVELKSF